MVLAFDPSADFVAVADGLEAVTLERRGSDSDSIANALKREIATREAAASDGKYTASDTRFHFPVSAVTSAPRLGDVIVDSTGERHTVIEVQSATLAKRYKCVTRSMAIVYGLDDAVTIERATYAKGTQGAVTRTWADWRIVRARIQPDAATAETTAGAYQATKRYKIYMAEDLELTEAHRFRAADGTLYKFAGFTGAESVGDILTVEVTAWPQ
jgi:head-tail adaptor